MGWRPGGEAGCGLDRVADARVGHAAAEVARHHRVDVRVGRVGKVLQQHGRLHDLSGLAVAALRHLQLAPGLLHRMVAGGIQALDRGDLGALDGADWGDAGPRRAASDMNRAGAAHADAAAELGALKSDLVAKEPEQGESASSSVLTGRPLTEKLMGMSLDPFPLRAEGCDGLLKVGPRRLVGAGAPQVGDEPGHIGVTESLAEGRHDQPGRALRRVDPKQDHADQIVRAREMDRAVEGQVRPNRVDRARAVVVAGRAGRDVDRESGSI